MYECYFVSSFSNGTISIIHYFYGVAFYLMFGLGILVSMPVHQVSSLELLDSSDAINITFGIFGFLLASYMQHKTMRTFATLRFKERDKQARGHYIPAGHLFEWVSSPHYLCEVLLYLSLCVITRWKNTYLVCTSMFVLANQVSASLSVHAWYKQTFRNYPKTRKALVPFVL
ncbi:polyprenol reductase [Elysia marginata]|uniref:Polyprenal reductase n=1 Tax=Elysia marginata TaxID=1093978 RepID=A0AAV4HZG2_9GAST|nr:polyprenol reductase [Elysia marginata]